MAEVTFEWIEGTDPRMEAVQVIILDRGWTPLNFQTSRARVAFDEHGQVVAFGIFQLFPMTGPMFVAPEYRGTGIAETLADDLATFLKDAHCRGYLVIADSPHSERLCQMFGMRKVESPVYLMPEGTA